MAETEIHTIPPSEEVAGEEMRRSQIDRQYNEEPGSIGRSVLLGSESPIVDVVAFQEQRESIAKSIEHTAYEKSDRAIGTVLFKETTHLMRDATTAHENSEISDDEMLEIADEALSNITQYRMWTSHLEDVLNAKGIEGCEELSGRIFNTFNLLQESNPPTLEQDATRTSQLLNFRGEHQYQAHKNFINRHAEDLVGEETELSESVQELWRQPEFLFLMGKRTRDNFETYGNPHEWDKKELMLYKQIFTSFGLGENARSSISNAWHSRRARRGIAKRMIVGETVQKSIQVMSELSKDHSEAVSDIHNTFGICHFGRYSALSLSIQREVFNGTMQRNSESVNLVVSATDDHNGAFEHIADSTFALNPVFMEVQSANGVVGAIARTKRKLGEINCLVLAAHGKEDAMFFSKMGAKGQALKLDELAKSRAFARFRQEGYFSDEAEIIMISCSTGREDGIADTMAEVTGLHVIAPDIPANGWIAVDPDNPNNYEVVFSDNKSRISRLKRKVGLSASNAATHFDGRKGKVRRPRRLNLVD